MDITDDKIETHEHLHNISELNELPDDVKNRLTVAGFGHFHSIKCKPKQISSLNKLLQKHYDATDKCFKFEEYKFFYGLRDIYLFFGLPIDGRPVHCESLSKDEARVFVREYLGGDTIDYCPRRGVPIHDLTIVSKDPAQTSDTRAMAMAALLIIIGSVIAPGPTENYVHIKHLPLVQNLDEVHLYSWGAAYLASVHEALSSELKKLCCSLCNIGFYFQYVTCVRLCLMTALEMVSLFLHFCWLKEFFKARKRVQMKFPLCVKCFEVMSLQPSAPTILKKSLKHNYLGRIVESIKKGRVVWDPTSNMKSPLREECLQMGQAIVPLICHEYINYHMPFVSPSQFNLHADEINVEACKARMIRHENFQDYVLHLQNWRENVLTLFMHENDQSDHLDGNTQNVSYSTDIGDHSDGYTRNESHSTGPSDYQEKDGTDIGDHSDGYTRNESHSTGPSDYQEQDGTGEDFFFFV
ncbi:hypothetical protein ACFE04_021120 [Oxalis oulophora]